AAMQAPSLAAQTFEIWARHSAGTPSGPYSLVGEGQSFCPVGSLVSDLAAGTAIPTASIVIDPEDFAADDLEFLMTPAANVSDLGLQLQHLILVDDEFMVVTSASAGGGNVTLSNVYRGVLDTVQANHPAGTSV